MAENEAAFAAGNSQSAGVAAIEKRIAFTGHHESHAASAFFPSPYEEAAILTIDGVGEWDTASDRAWQRQSYRDAEDAASFRIRLGLLYSAFTYFCGFKVNSGEYKLMGLAPYGEPKYADIILDKLIDLKADGSLQMDMRYFNYCAGLTMTGPEFEKLFGGPARNPEALITQREMDLAASIQKVTEEVVLRMAKTARELTGSRYLCLAGGVALNCVANGKLLRAGIFDDIFITPAAGDAGGALGAAQFVHYQLLEKPRVPNRKDSLKGSLLGPRYKDAEIKQFLDERKAPYARLGTRKNCSRRSHKPWRMDWWWAGFTGRWNSGRARSERAASSAMRGMSRCNRQ